MPGVTIELCETKHGELREDLREIKEWMCKINETLTGNGRPGLRQTQSDVERLRKDFEHARQSADENKQRQQGWIMFLLRPLLPIIYGVFLAGFYVYFAG